MPGNRCVFHDEILGVLAVFTKTRITQPALDILNIIANHAATALANARAFERIEELTQQLEAENSYLREELQDVTSYGGFIGRSAALERIVRQIDLVAPTDANVLIQGESGTGKELVARELHQRSERRGKPLIKVNCASIPKGTVRQRILRPHKRGVHRRTRQPRGQIRRGQRRDTVSGRGRRDSP